MDKVVTISALASVYIKEKPEFLDLALASVASQTLPAHEVVLVHDGPLTTELYDVIEKWKSQLPIKEVILEENQGLGKALNAGLAACTNELVARFDTDDINREKRFEKQVLLFEQDPELSIASSVVLEFEEQPEDLDSARVVSISHEEIMRKAKYRNPFNHMSVMFKKSCIEAVGGYKHLHFMEDYYLWLRLLADGYKCANIDEILVDARVGNGMHARRKGLSYVRTERKLYKIKRHLGISGQIEGVFIFILRVLPRLLPSSALRKVYKFLRN